jgi:hypothetical protein
MMTKTPFLSPEEAYRGIPPANRGPRYEPLATWPRGSPYVASMPLVKRKPGVVLTLDVSYLEGRKHLPIIKLRRAA